MRWRIGRELERGREEAHAPQAAPDPKCDPLVMVRGIVLDVSYQLK